MPFGAVELQPGVDVQRTPSLNQAGVSVAQLIRYKEGLISPVGGWQSYSAAAVPSTARCLHAWQDVNLVKHLGIGATSNLQVITAGSNQDITPQTTTTNTAPDFSISSGSQTVTIVDNNADGLPTVFNRVFFNTPVAIGNLLLNGAYPIASVLSSVSYTIVSSVVSSTTIASSGLVPGFNTTAGSGTVTVTLDNNNFISAVGVFYPFFAPTTIAAKTIQGRYQIQSILSASQFTINLTAQASATSSANMNGGLAQIVYYVTLGPQPTGSGFGAGGFGSGGFGTGVSLTGTAGTPITATDWSLVNWGEILLACPTDGPIYAWSPNNNFVNAQVVPTAPFFNGGIFISMPQQILVAWRSTQPSGAQDPLLVTWSDAEDYTNWTVSNQTAAGSFHIPTGSIIVGGLQASTQGIIWTDIDVYVMHYIGGDLIFNFTRVGVGCGLIAQHAAADLNGIVFWMGNENFFMLGPEGVVVIPCSVWDFVFQNLSSANKSKICCASNATFNEITWYFPSAASAGENDAYVKFNLVEKEWDYGHLDRTAWVDVTVLGNPIGADRNGVLYQHETGDVTTGAAVPSFQSGWWSIAEGNELAFVDFVIPDFKWGTYAGAQNATVTMTFLAADYPGATPRTYGPYTLTAATQYITPRIRGRLMAVQVDGDGQSYWRLGRLRYRWAGAGRR